MATGTREMLSVGIDIGTTTSQLVLSRLTVSNQARVGLVPRLDVDERAVLYQSEPHLTPLSSPDEINVTALVRMIHEEYIRAGIDSSQVETGAVIITGETARTRNAEAILQGLSDLAGDFVVTVAGPSLESQIAGRGSGASDWAADHYATIVNVDIGGGSANAAIFRAGKHVTSAAVMVGGRQAIIDPDSGRLVHLKPAGRDIVEHLGLDLRVGEPVSLSVLRQFTDAMAEVVVDLVLGRTSPLGEKLALTPPLAVDGPVAAYFISGGVAAAQRQGQAVDGQRPALGGGIERFARRAADVHPVFRGDFDEIDTVVVFGQSKHLFGNAAAVTQACAVERAICCHGNSFCAAFAGRHEWI